MRDSLRVTLLLVLMLTIGSTFAINKRQAQALEQSQNRFAAMVRWGEIETAWQMVDPKYRAEHPLDDQQLERHQQIRVTSYRPIITNPLNDNAIERIIEIRMVNTQDMVERTFRYREQWRWEKNDKRWWQISGLPDFWNDQPS
ncbi:MAG: hypothetical protein LBV45_04035 [Xanthomonadaceae bacterium]|jgi:hypothetical protein|nr:hypothetical protein [Xanthomonadaceae bacterium]